jgi:uncharacterized protein (UPF0335 family)
MTDISSQEDVLDVRDIIERVEELRGERDDLKEYLAEAIEALNGHDETCMSDIAELKADVDTRQNDLAEWLASSEAAELAQLESLLDDMKGYGGDHEWEGDWYPVTLIRDSYFEDAMRELVQDIGDLPKEIPSYLAIDWEQTAKNLQQDYSSVEFDDVTYWYR